MVMSFNIGCAVVYDITITALYDTDLHQLGLLGLALKTENDALRKCPGDAKRRGLDKLLPAEVRMDHEYQNRKDVENWPCT